MLILLASIGIVCIISYTALFKSTRELLSKKHDVNLVWSFFYHLINCPYCIGTWAGVFTSWYMGFPINEIILYGLSSSFLSGLSINLINLIKRK